MAETAFLGLGVMGFPMAGHLARAGHGVAVYNRTAARAGEWTLKHRGNAQPTPSKAAENADIVFCCVGRDDDLRQVTLGPDGAFGAMKKGSVFVDHTTASAEIARELHAEAASRGFGFLDAPVSGGQAGAENGELSIMIGGEADIYARIQPVLEAYAKRQRLIGPPGCGQLAKMVNQICIAGLVQGLAEALGFAQNADLDIPAVIDVISKGAAQSWQMENRWKTMAEDKYDFGFAVDWMRKDLGLCLDEAKRNGSRLPVVALVDQFYGDLQAQGGGRQDTSSLLRRLKTPQ